MFAQPDHHLNLAFNGPVIKKYIFVSVIVVDDSFGPRILEEIDRSETLGPKGLLLP